MLECMFGLALALVGTALVLERRETRKLERETARIVLRNRALCAILEDRVNR